MKFDAKVILYFRTHKALHIFLGGPLKNIEPYTNKQLKQMNLNS